MLNMGKKTEKTEKTVPRTYDYCGSCTFYLFAIIVTLICQAVAGVLSAALSAKFDGIAENGDFNTAFMIFIQAVNLAFIAYYTKRNNYKFDFAVIGGKNNNGKALWAAMAVVPVIGAALLLVAMYLPTVWYGFFTQYALKLDPELGSINLTTTSATVMIVIASVFLAPMCEETIYRGVLLHGLKQKKSTAKAILLSALAFMLMHMSPVQVVFQFSLGVVGAYMTLKSERLFPSILMHATANALALVMELTPFGGVLGDCVAWLTQNITAAVFITLGLFVCGGGALYALIRFGFGLAKRTDKTRSEIGENYDENVTTGDENTPEAVKSRMISAERDRNGTYMYYIGVGLCAIVFIFNLAVSVL